MAAIIRNRAKRIIQAVHKVTRLGIPNPNPTQRRHLAKRLTGKGVETVKRSALKKDIKRYRKGGELNLDYYSKNHK